MDNNIKEVYFHLYCNKCEHAEKTEFEYPCDECMNYSYNTNSHKPVFYKPMEDE